MPPSRCGSIDGWLCTSADAVGEKKVIDSFRVCCGNHNSRLLAHCSCAPHLFYRAGYSTSAENHQTATCRDISPRLPLALSCRRYPTVPQLRWRPAGRCTRGTDRSRAGSVGGWLPLSMEAKAGFAASRLSSEESLRIHASEIVYRFGVPFAPLICMC